MMRRDPTRKKGGKPRLDQAVCTACARHMFRVWVYAANVTVAGLCSTDKMFGATDASTAAIRDLVMP